MIWIEKKIQNAVATIGFFDGVHLGHRFLIDQVKKEANIRGLASLLITFPLHPRKVMNADFQPELLTTLEEKKRRLAQTEVDYCAMLNFSLALSQLSAHDFMQQILKEQLGVKALVIGWDHRFGHNRAEGFEDYVAYGQELGIEVIQAEAWKLADCQISSSAIRRMLKEGYVKEAAKGLGYHYSLQGTVVDGHQIGRTLGFPTANLQVTTDKLIPRKGVYAVNVRTEEGDIFKGMLNIGSRPTLNNGEKNTIEVHLLHFSGNLYNKPLELEFIERIREERCFDSLDALREQLLLDKKAIETMCEQDDHHENHF